jgi:large subunit ribosomal protein L22
MEAFALLRDANISAQKVRLVTSPLTTQSVSAAMERLRFMPHKAAKIVSKVLASAIANAEMNQGLDVDRLVVKEIFVDGATMLKRVQPRAKGRSDRVLKRRCHIKIVVSSRERG